jgi:hypothetical protein
LNYILKWFYLRDTFQKTFQQIDSGMHMSIRHRSTVFISVYSTFFEAISMMWSQVLTPSFFRPNSLTHPTGIEKYTSSFYCAALTLELSHNREGGSSYLNTNKYISCSKEEL